MPRCRGKPHHAPWTHRYGTESGAWLVSREYESVGKTWRMADRPPGASFRGQQCDAALAGS